MRAPKISILMPLYNGTSTMDNAIHSLQWQTFKDWELIIVDDGSTDGSLSKAQIYAQNDKRIRVLARPHRGIISSLNEGLEACNAPWIARMDSDDISAPRRLERQLDFLDTNPDIAVLGTYVRLFPQRNRTLGMRRYESWLNRYWKSEDLAKDIFVESPIVHPSAIIDKKVILNVGGYRQCPWPEDYDLWFRLWRRGYKLAKVPEILFFWRDGEQRLTRTDARCSHTNLRNLKLHYLVEAYRSDKCGSGTVPVLIWGAGTNGKDLVRDLRKLGISPAGFVDNHRSRRGQTILNIPVWGLDQVEDRGKVFIVMAVSNPYVRAEVRELLNFQGKREGRDFICLANMAR